MDTYSIAQPLPLTNQGRLSLLLLMEAGDLTTEVLHLYKINNLKYKNWSLYNSPPVQRGGQALLLAHMIRLPPAVAAGLLAGAERSD